MVGRVLEGKYRVLAPLGHGGMGSVFEAEHLRTGRHVAVKVIRTAEVATDARRGERLQREARAAGALDTEHIVQVLDCGWDEETGHPFIVMELLSGEGVDGLIARLGPLPPSLALSIVAGACLGLDTAHEAGVIHRDVKPANLYLARRGEKETVVKLLDFGIAKIEAHWQPSLTTTGSLVGSPLYMSPEQAKGLKTIDRRTDVWSLGVVLYEALTGCTPFGQFETVGQVILAICGEDPTPVQEHAPWVEPEVADVVHRALQVDPARRFQSAREMFEAVTPLLRGRWAISESLLIALTQDQRLRVARRRRDGAEPPAFGQTTIDPDHEPRSKDGPSARRRALPWVAVLLATGCIAIVVAGPRLQNSSRATEGAPASAAPPTPMPRAVIRQAIDVIPSAASASASTTSAAPAISPRVEAPRPLTVPRPVAAAPPAAPPSSRPAPSTAPSSAAPATSASEIDRTFAP